MKQLIHNFKPFILALLLLPSLLLASVGKITVSNGDVTISRAGKAIKGISNTPIEEKDAITTKAGSGAQVIFTDGTAISIGANTNFKVQEYMFDEKANNANIKVGVSEGAFKAITGKIGKVAPDKFRLETRTATIGIRGTAFLGIVPPPPASPDLPQMPETIACTKGAIAIAPLPVPVIAAPVPAGQPAPAPAGQAAPSAKVDSTTTTPSAAPAPAVGAAPAGAPAPTAPAMAPVPAPAPVFVEVKAGEMTSISVGKVEAPRPFTKAEIQKLEKASSAAPAEKKSEPAPAAGGDKKSDSGDKGSGDKGPNGNGDKKAEGGGDKPLAGGDKPAPSPDQPAGPTPPAPIPAPIDPITPLPPMPLPPMPPMPDLPDLDAFKDIVKKIIDSEGGTGGGSTGGGGTGGGSGSCASGFVGIPPFCVPIDNTGGGGGSGASVAVTDSSFFKLYPVNPIVGYIPNFDVDFTTVYSSAPTAVASTPQTKVVRFFGKPSTESFSTYNPFYQGSQIYTNTQNNNILHFDLKQVFHDSYSQIDNDVAIGTFGANGTFSVNNESSWYSNGSVLSPYASGAGQMYSNGNTFGMEFTEIHYSSASSAQGDTTISVYDAGSYFKAGDQIKIGSDIYTIASVSGSTITLTSGLVSALSSSYVVYGYEKIGGIKDTGYTVANEAAVSVSGTMPVVSGSVTITAGASNQIVTTSALTPDEIVIVQFSNGSTYGVPVTVGASGSITIPANALTAGTYSTVTVTPYSEYTSTSYLAKGTWTGLVLDSAALGNLSSISTTPSWLNGPDIANYNSSTNLYATISKSDGNITLTMADKDGHLPITSSTMTNSAKTSAYISEDMWAMLPTTGSWDSTYSLQNTRFMALPDSIQCAGDLCQLGYSDDYSSWGYWQTDYNTTATSSKSAIGWWVAGAITPTSVIDALISTQKTYTYNGHVMGAAVYNNTAVEMIKMDGANKAQLTVAFGAANPVTGSLAFQTGSSSGALKSWNVSFSGTGATSANSNFVSSGNFASNASFGFNGVGSGTGNGAAVTATTLNGQYYGPAANSVGGSFAIKTGNDSAQGVFKAKR